MDTKVQIKSRYIVAAATLLALIFVTFITACDKSDRSVSLLAQNQTFQQAGNNTFSQNQVDVLWVVDNSSSMDTSQANLANNYASFITQFQTLGFDYHMAVTTTDAYLANSYFNNAMSDYQPTIAQFRDGFVGQFGLGLSGITVMTSQNTTSSIFQKNMSEGTSGSGDERAFSSFVQALSDPTNTNSGFRRSSAFLAIIILSDEDDFSGNASFCDHFDSACATTSTSYVGDHNFTVQEPELHTVSYYTSWLDNYVGNHSNYSVSSIFTDTSSCLTTLNQNDPSTSRIIAQRYPAMATATSGVSSSLCGNFNNILTNISQSIISLASVFTLNAPANPSTIAVTVNGVSVPNDPTNGWTFNATTNAVSFHGTAIPPAGATINITYTPTSALNN